MQTTYDLDYPVGIEGQKIEAYPAGIITGLAEGGIIVVAKVVVMDTTSGRNDKAAKHPTTAAMITGAHGLRDCDRERRQPVRAVRVRRRHCARLDPQRRGHSLVGGHGRRVSVAHDDHAVHDDRRPVRSRSEPLTLARTNTNI
jgi:hypothetical protein